MALFSNIMTVSAEEVSTEDKSPYQKAYEDTVAEYENDKQFKLMVEDYGIEYGEEFLRDIAQMKVSNNLVRGGGGNVCYQYVTNIMQTKNYNCGSTTTLQTLYGLNSASNVSGSSYAAQISTLDARYNVDAQGSMMVYQVSNALKDYGNRTYAYKTGDSMTLDQFEANVANSLTAGKPVILHAKTEQISYYKGKASNHYLSVDYVNRTTDRVRIVDCSFHQEFFGAHDVSLTDAYKSVSAVAGRYLIY